MMGTHPYTKSDLRRALRARRRRVRGRLARQAAGEAARRVTQLDAWHRARHVAVYLPTDGEIDTRPLIHTALRAGKRVYLPVIRRPTGDLVFRRYTPGAPLRRGAFGLPVPVAAGAPRRPLAGLDVLIMPLVGFDGAGHRLGMGGGFYDRTLAGRGRGRRPLRVGLAHALQQRPAIPTDRWDQRLDRVVTDRAIHVC